MRPARYIGYIVLAGFALAMMVAFTGCSGKKQLTKSSITITKGVDTNKAINANLDLSIDTSTKGIDDIFKRLNIKVESGIAPYFHDNAATEFVYAVNKLPLFPCDTAAIQALKKDVKTWVANRKILPDTAYAYGEDSLKVKAWQEGGKIKIAITRKQTIDTKEIITEKQETPCPECNPGLFDYFCRAWSGLLLLLVAYMLWLTFKK